MISQSENYRLHDLVYPFARAECEPPSPAFPDVRPPVRGPAPALAELADRILDCLARADEPLAVSEIAAAVGATGALERTQVRHALDYLRRHEEVAVVGTLRPDEGRPVNLWALA